ncbi:MAG: cytochrome c oxidase subunit II [Spirochaetales bacterium]|nr:cytochrome c oxidase subunit II [Spirochaetales bacterium]MCP5485269.1 cytochrome c oxidase subunit II [Spirochaetales bacterium]
MYIEGASNHAPGVDSLMLWINIITIAAFIIVNAVLVYFIIRYRRRGDNDRTSRVAHNTTIEVVWTVIPSIVFVWLYIWGMIVFLEMRHQPSDAREVLVSGTRWQWDFTYPDAGDDVVTVATQDELILEAGKPVKLIMQATDVLHSFFVPAFRVKEDVVPGVYTYVSFIPYISETSEDPNRSRYQVFCTEYCGKEHSMMLADAIVLSSEAYQARMAELLEKARIDLSNITAERGQEIYTARCASCHSVDGSVVVGPSFQGIVGRSREFTDGSTVVADENYIRQSILQPESQVVAGFPNAMPPQNLDNASIQSIILYMKSLQ